MAKVTRQNPTRKKAMVQALEKSLGVVTTACKSVGINRATHYEWLEKDSKYAEQVEAIKDIALDFAESQLHKRMQNGSDTAIIFYLKTQGKKRGYIERTQVEHSGKIEGALNELTNEQLDALINAGHSGKGKEDKS